ncbi:MAG: hypothetical protein ACI9BW_002088, partial [Gammaproteobacteria bacterium]
THGVLPLLYIHSCLTPLLTIAYNAYCAFAAAHHNAKVPANADTFALNNGEPLQFFND